MAEPTKTILKKIKREPFYSDLLELHGFARVIEGGFFDNGNDTKIDWKQHVNILCTPINFLAPLKRPSVGHTGQCVILSTGGFCPLHDGHVEMMGAAKTELEQRGYEVMGGYLSPGHDDYLREKTGDEWMPIHDRIRWANEMIKDVPWLAIDPWEGVYAPGAVNFTTVAYRLHKYITKHVGEGVDVFFVCGGDNARFILPFAGCDGFGCVVVERPGYEYMTDRYKLESAPNVIFTSGYNISSSTSVRKTDKYKAFNKRQAKQLHLRMSWTNVERLVLVKLKEHFSHVWVEDIDEQNKDFKMQSRIKETVINMDAESNHGRKLNISRLYDIYGQKRLGFTHRPGSKPVEKQIKQLLADEYFREAYLFDDDICSGSSMNYVEGLLAEHGVKVLGRISFISGMSADKEVLDARDFILAYSNGGLVVNFNRQLVRLPYMYPFVCPCTRASIGDPLQFSIDMWKINMDFWENKDNTIRGIQELHWLTKLGHKPDSSLYDVCRYYHGFLSNLKR